MNPLFKITVIAAAMLSLPVFTALDANAEVTILTDAESVQQRNDKQYFSQDGLSGEEARVIPGAGAGMPLKAAAKILVPAGWQVVGSGEFERALISWRGGLAWPQILRDIAQREKIFISLDWVKKVASINVPSTHATFAKNDTAVVAKVDTTHREKNQNAPTITVQKKPEPAVQQKLIAQTPAKAATAKLAEAAAKNAIQNNLAVKSSLADKNKDLYIADLEVLLKKSRETALIAQQSKVQLATLLPKQPSGLTAAPVDVAPVDVAKLRQQYRERAVLPFNGSFEYFAAGGYADRFNAETPATFIAKPGTVEQVISNWADAIGYGVEYRAGVQHNNDYEVEIKGTFFEAAIQMIKVYESSDRPLNIEFYPDVRVSETKKGLVIISDLRLN